MLMSMKRIHFLPIIPLIISGCVKQPQSKGDSAEPPTPRVVTATGDARFPAIAAEGAPAKSRVTYRFLFEGRKHKISIKVDEAVYQGARNAEKVAVVPVEMKDADLSTEFQAALMNDPNLEPFYDTLLGELRRVKQQLGLDDDRYQELLISFVQQIDYCNDHADNPKFPIETFVEKCGDCDDKSRLLGALLTREGFDVVLLLFSEEAHMAVGLKAPPLDYKGTGYGYVETTSPALIGFLADENTNVRISSTPKVVPVGDGKKTYGGGKDLAYLRDTFTEMKACVEALKPDIETGNERCQEQEAALKTLKDELDRTPKSEPDKRKAAIARYNGAVDKFNKLVAKRNDLAAEINTCAEVFNYMLKNATDRPGVYRWVRAALKD